MASASSCRSVPAHSLRGHRWPGALQNNHNRILQRRNGHPAHIRCHRRALIQQSHHSNLDIRNWIRNIEQHASEDVNKILVGNKCDMLDKKVITKEQGLALADEYAVKFMETSAKSNIGKLVFFIATCYSI